MATRTEPVLHSGWHEVMLACPVCTKPIMVTVYGDEPPDHRLMPAHWLPGGEYDLTPQCEGSSLLWVDVQKIADIQREAGGRDALQLRAHP